MPPTSSSELGPLLADEAEWVGPADGVPASGAVTHRRAVSLASCGEDDPRGEIHAIIEPNLLVVVEGKVPAPKSGGKGLNVRFIHTFEIAGGRVRGLSSVGAVPNPAA